MAPVGGAVVEGIGKAVEQQMTGDIKRQNEKENGPFTRLTLLLAVFFSCPWIIRADEQTDLEEPPIWNQFFDLRTEFGYRDNPTYTSTNPSGSTFGTFKLEYTLARLPVDQWQVLILSSADATYFFDSALTDHELFAFNLFQVQKETLPGRNWEVGLQHVYQDQIVDASTTVANRGSVSIRGNTLQSYTTWKQQWPSGWWISLKPALEWQSVAAPLDNSYEPQISFSLGREIGKRTSFSITYTYQERVFETLTPTDALGVPRPDGNLHFRQHQVDAVYRHSFDEARQWRLTLRSGWTRNSDNGGAFYTYDKGRIALELGWHKKPWEIKLSSRASYYNYSVQRIAGVGSELREKALISAGLQVRRTFKHGWYLIGRGEHEQSLSNLSTDTYTANVISIGLGWEN